MGIRPENIHDEMAFLSMADESAQINTEIKVYEMMGAEVFLYFDIEGVSFTARVNPRTNARVGSTVKFALDTNKIHVFDKETQLTITN